MHQLTHIIFRILIGSSIIIYALLLMLPYFWPSLYEPEIIEAIVWGNGMHAAFEQVETLYYLIPLLFFVSCVGQLFYMNWARYLYVATVFGTLLYGLGLGLYVQGVVDSLLNQLLSILDGMIIAVAFFSTISKEFSTKD